MVDESGLRVPGASIAVAYLKQDNPNITITLTNWMQHMVRTNMVTDNRGEASISGIGAPDAWQCSFNKQGFTPLHRIYSGPSNMTGTGGPGPAHQKHTEMLVRTNASTWAYPKWTVEVKAMDQAGKPVQDATVTVYYYSRLMSAHTNDVGRTDSNGMLRISRSDPSWDVRVAVEKPNYKPVSKGISFGPREAYDPVRWNPTMTLVLERVEGP
jgi:hypothetical protein